MSGSQSPSVFMLAFGCHYRRCVASISLRQDFVGLLRAHTLVKIVVAHQHRRRAAAREAFDELEREFAVLRRLDTVRARIQAELAAETLVQFVRTAQRATNCTSVSAASSA